MDDIFLMTHLENIVLGQGNHLWEKNNLVSCYFFIFLRQDGKYFVVFEIRFYKILYDIYLLCLSSCLRILQYSMMLKHLQNFIWHIMSQTRFQNFIWHLYVMSEFKFQNFIVIYDVRKLMGIVWLCLFQVLEFQSILIYQK